MKRWPENGVCLWKVVDWTDVQGEVKSGGEQEKEPGV